MLLFVIVTWQVAAQGPLRELDEHIGSGARGRLLPASLAEILADLGNTTVALPVLGVAIAYAAWRGRRHAGRSPGTVGGPPTANTPPVETTPAAPPPADAASVRRAPDAPGSAAVPGASAEGDASGGGDGPSLRRTPAVRGTHAVGRRPWWLPPLAAALAMALVPALVAPVKTLLARPAPPGPLAGTDGFYPSGHAATAALAYGAAALLLLGCSERSPAPRRRRPLAAAVAAAVVVAVVNVGVGVGLVLRGYHWPLDVVGGWCLSGVLLSAVLMVTTRSPRRRREERPDR
ncbi:phosphatase PAP2 family protein [Streptomyces sp. SAJ15]|uniref:phosphatase PAP2 family protein n=1 Tax=Streptomyces sp. SAJ15 TaxID=2011095 RepID=UPI0028CB6F1E|nr:phosphatase PAP2 family protein [Streptomyces sp. SAJ15]